MIETVKAILTYVLFTATPTLEAKLCWHNYTATPLMISRGFLETMTHWNAATPSAPF